MSAVRLVPQIYLQNFRDRTLEPVDGGRRTRVTGVAVADPRGSIPTWVVNLYQRNWPSDTIMAMRGQAKKSGLTVLPRLRPLYTALRKRIE